MSRLWVALQIEAPAVDVPPGVDDLLPALLDDYSPLAIEDLAERPLPPGGLWDPTFPPIPEPPPTPLRWRVFFPDEPNRQAAAEAIASSMPRSARYCSIAPALFPRSRYANPSVSLARANRGAMLRHFL